MPNWPGRGPAQPMLFAELRNELVETLDRTAPSHSRMNGITAGAQSVVLRLKVKPGIKIQRRTILIELSAHPASAGEDEIDLLGA